MLAQTIRATNEQEPSHSDIDSATECSELAKEQSTASKPTPTEANVSSALTVQRRPPLVRAMSAPVRMDESSKSALAAASKRSQQKQRRRKIFTRATSSVAVPPDNSPMLSTDASGSGKKALSRTRSVIAQDVITLVSLLSSEGSDSEREENSSASSEKQPPAALQRSPQRRAPLLRKTGKSGKC